MGLYNTLFGVNPQSEEILTALNLSVQQIPRFRDAYLSERNSKQVAAIYTRMGSGNRGHWSEDNNTEAGPQCGCPGCRAQHGLATHPLYIADQDDDFDSTYATYYFEMPATLSGANSPTPTDKWRTFLNNQQS